MLDADPNKPGRWNGKLRVREQGQSITLDYRMDMVNDERIMGTRSGDFRVARRKCTLTREFVLTYRGK